MCGRLGVLEVGCVGGWVCGWMDGCVGGWMCGRLGVWVDGWVRMDEYVDVVEFRNVPTG